MCGMGVGKSAAVVRVGGKNMCIDAICTTKQLGRKQEEFVVVLLWLLLWLLLLHFPSLCRCPNQHWIKLTPSSPTSVFNKSRSIILGKKMSLHHLPKVLGRFPPHPPTIPAPIISSSSHSSHTRAARELLD